MPAKVLLPDSPVDDATLNLVARLPTTQLSGLIDEAWLARLGDADVMRLAVLLARKSYEEGGCPIGAVIIDNSTRRIVGKGHNTLVQDGDPYNHGETSAIRDAGRRDFSRATLFTSLSPCDVCAMLVVMRGFSRLVVGDVTNAAGNEALIRDRGVTVDILEDPMGIALYARFRNERPELDLEDWKGLAAVNQANPPK